jgi:hypothetical protein
MTYKLWDRIISLYKDFKKPEEYLYWLVPLIFGIWTMPRPITFPGPTLDSSWIIGLNIASLENLQFGKDIIFTFGPLGFLWTPLLLNYHLWVSSLVIILITHFLVIGCIFNVIKKAFEKLNYRYTFVPMLICVIPILIFANPLYIEYKLLIIASLILYLILTDSSSLKERPYVFIFIGLLLSIATLIKFNAFFMSTSIMVMFFLCCILVKKNLKYGTYLLTTYFIFLISIWIVTGQDIYNLVNYFYNGIEISNGYTEALSYPGPGWQVFLGIFCLCIFIFTIIPSAKESKKNVLVFLLLNLGILLVSFKHGFIRQDGHQLIFFQICLLLFLLLSILIYSYSSDRKLKSVNYFNVFLIISLLLTLYHLAPWLLNDSINNKYQDYVLSEKMVDDPGLFEEQVIAHKNLVRDYYPLDKSITKYLENKTVDIFPWDISLAWAYGLEWSPRPIFQSYSAYTQNLDRINSRHLIGNNSPNNILYSFKSIDERYPPFDEPATFRNVLCNYSFVNKSGEFLLLTNNPRTINKGSEVNLGELNSPMGSIISIPKYNEGYVFGYIDVEYSFIGKIIKLFYKSSPCSIQFKFSDNLYSKEFRFIPDVAKNGVFLSQFILNQEDLSFIFQGQCINNIEGIIIKTSSPMQYSSNIKVKFVGIPACNDFGEHVNA